MAVSTIKSSFIEGNDDTSNLEDNSTRFNPFDIKNRKSIPSFKDRKVLYVILSVVILLFVSVLSFGLFFKNSNIISPTLDKLSDIAEESKGILGDTYENPVNGVVFPKDKAQEFKDRKPIAVMVNNYVVARPSSGLSKADVVYEAVAEGGITRLMPIFFSKIPDNVGSVRSARYYFVELAAGYKAHYIHWGAAHVPPCQNEPSTSLKYCPPVGGKVETEPDVDAYSRIVQLGVPNLDGGNYSCDGEGCAFGRDPKKLGKMPLEHTAFTRLPLIFDLAKQIRQADSWHKYVEITKWHFKDDASLNERGDIGLTPPITYNYWDTMPGFNVKWEYNKENNEYVRYQGDVKQIDFATDEELKAKVIVIRLTKQELVGDKKNHLYHELVGKGAALIFQDGKVIKGFWNRTTHEERDYYTDENGDDVKLNRGQIWVQLVPVGNKINYGEESSATPPEGAATNNAKD